MRRPDWLPTRPLRRLEPGPRVLDWSLAASVVLILATGFYSLVAGRPGQAWVFDLHAIAGLGLVVLLAFKLRRVAPRVTPDRLTGPGGLSLALAVVSAGALATGLWWVLGGSVSIGPWGLLNLHIGVGLLVPIVLLLHLRHRFHDPRDVPNRDRRTALQYAGIAGVAALTWRSQRVVNDLLETAGADRRFTGSREVGSDEGNAFPPTSWMADDPDPIHPEAWTLSVTGRVASPQSYAADDLVLDPDAASERRALLDCTSGWYSEHDWQGVAVADLLEAAEPTDAAAWVQFRSVTGYRWSLPIEEAKDALLATHVDGDPLTHGHGAPMRLVAPGRRGLQWVKWVEEVRLSRRREIGESIAIFVSGFEE
jgi:cytochrome b561